MGLQATETENGARVLVIDQACDNDQLLVSLSKNGSQWLSPVGWTDQQKVTLLDCRANGETTEIDIPAEFAKDIVSGDVLVLRCSELDFEKEIIWETSEIEVRNTAEIAATTTGLASGLLSRFKSPKPEAVEVTKSEAEIRAEEADRAAQSYKAKMEAATQAKERAQQKALDAAREAEAALKMEAERIAEMERAAKAFEEAERLKQDEMRRVEEERRIEEARLAEEARRLEEARLREIAAKKEAERKAALERYTAALDITRDEERRLKSRLKALKAQAKDEAANKTVQADDLESRRGLLVVTEETAQKNAKRYNETAMKLDAGQAELANIQNQADSLKAERENTSARVSQADADYQQAQKEAEAAIAKAEAMRAKLDEARHAEGDISSRVSLTTEKLSTQTLVTNDLTLKMKKLKTKSEAAQAELAQAKTEIEAIEQSLAGQAEKEHGLRLEIEATQQAIEDSQARELSHRDAIDHLEAGGSPEDITEVDFEARDYSVSAAQTELTEAPIATEKSTGLMGRVRSKFAREKDAEISIAVEDVVLEAAEQKADPVLLAGVDETPSFIRRHSSSLMALGAVIGGIAILGGGFALNKSAAPKLEVKAKAPAPTQVASAVMKAELPKASSLDVMEEAKAELAPSEVTPPTIELPKIEIAETEPMVAPAKAEVDLTETDFEAVPETVDASALPVTEEAVLAAEVGEDPLMVKLAEVVDPVGFAFELPDMMPSPQSASKPAAKAASVKKPAVKASTATVTVPKPADKKAQVEEDVNYPELTRDVQTRLTALGFYSGEIDGAKGPGTREAIKTFKSLFSLPVDHKINGDLLSAMKRAEREQEEIRLIQQAQDEAAKAREAAADVQVAEVAPSIEIFDTVQAVPSTPVVTDSLPAATSYDTEAVTIAPAPTIADPVIVQTPEPVAPTPEPVKVASLPTPVEPAPTPVIQDVIEEAKLLNSASAKYPRMAERRNYYVNVAIEVAYDIDASGRATNISIASNDHSGKYNEAFEKEAMKVIEKLRYAPKTVNGEAVIETGKEKRIVFRAE